MVKLGVIGRNFVVDWLLEAAEKVLLERLRLVFERVLKRDIFDTAVLSLRHARRCRRFTFFRLVPASPYCRQEACDLHNLPA